VALQFEPCRAVSAIMWDVYTVLTHVIEISHSVQLTQHLIRWELVHPEQDPVRMVNQVVEALIVSVVIVSIQLHHALHVCGHLHGVLQLLCLDLRQKGVHDMVKLVVV
jgi:uncharacterized protein with PQ loop repeat